MESPVGAEQARMQAQQPVLALDISGSRTFLARFDPGLGPRREVVNEGRGVDAYWSAIRAEAVRLAQEGVPVEAVGIAFGGPVGRDGRILSIHVAGWGTLDPAAELREALGVPVVVENDANCGAVGEFREGAWDDPELLVFLTCSTGIGGGIVDQQGLFRGSRGLAGELGHLCIDPRGRPCACGSRGCLEAMCSGTAIRDRGTEAWQAAGRVGLADPPSGAREVFEAAGRGVAWAVAVLEAVCADFGRGIAAIQHALDPDQIVIGGGVSLAGEALIGPVLAAAEPWLMTDKRGLPRLGVASLGLEAQLWGAACLARDALRQAST